VATFTGSVWLGLLAGVIATIAVSLIHGYASIDQRANQIVSGTAINMVADGMTALIGNAIWSQGGRTPELPAYAQFQTIELPFAGVLGTVPIVGPIYEHLISGHDLITYAAFLLVPLTYWALYSTRFGLRLRAVGENPAAVDTAGISVRALRYGAVMICGVLVGLAGVYLVLSQEAYFQPHMSAGRGFIALAALVFAKWRPWPALATCLLFGFLDALAIRMQGVELPVIGPVPVQAIEALPYILTVVLLAGFIGKAIPPKASGIPYVKER
jgi:general nucleoside transport system permease protein